MILRLIREPSVNERTFGVLFIDGRYECFSLEDTVREVVGQPVATWKVPKRTAIPAGRYRIIVTPSRRFNRPLPLLLDVPGFDGVRIHPGNTVEETDGCLLVGADRHQDRVLKSVVAFERLFTHVWTAIGDIWIVVEPARVESEAA